jgi:glucose/arabinose dehydrogenase
MLMRTLNSLAVAMTLGTAACSGQAATTPPPANGDGSSPGSPINVSGTERLGWNQTATDLNEASRLQYTIYVDDGPAPLTDATCQGSSPFSCSARLPQLTAGAHRLEVTATASGLESPRSPSIYVVLVINKGASVAGPVAASAPRSVTASDGAILTLETLATGLDTPSALAATVDGRIFIAQASGTIVVWQANRILAESAIALPDVNRLPGVGLIGMALDRDFSSNGRVYVAYVGTSRSGELVNRVVRFREVNNLFGEAAVILEDRIAAAPPRAPRIRMGPDRKLYIAFPAINWETAERFASYAGKVLRINDDGTTPRDNPGSSPILSADHAAAGGLDWAEKSGRLWIAERDRLGQDVLNALSTMPLALDSGLEPAGIAVYPADRSPAFANDLFVAGLSGQRLRRVHLDPRDPTRVQSMENLLEGQLGRLSDVIAAPDGALYLLTSNAGTVMGAVNDRLLRLSPVTR